MWTTKTLGEACIKTETINPKLKPDDLFTYIDVSSVSKETLQIEETQQIKGEKAPSRARRRVRKDDVIFATIRPTLRRVACISEANDGDVCSTGYIVLRPKPELHFRYLFYWLISDAFIARMAEQQTGASYPAVTDKQVRDELISYPPLSEQQRIVDKLDAAFAEIDAAAEAERKKSDAISTLFTNYLNHAFDCDAANNGTVNLGNCCELQNGFAFKSSKFKSEGVPIIRISNIQSGQVSTQKLVYTDPADYVERLDKYIVVEGDLLIAMSGATTGKVGINNTSNSYYLNQRVGLLRPKDTLLKNYLYFFLTTKVDENLSISAGAAQPNLSSKQIREIKIPNISLEQQAEFMDRTELLERQQLEYLAATEQKILEYGKLKSAILAQELQSEVV